jgi:cell wall-associated NlpC family hydrolase
VLLLRKTLLFFTLMLTTFMTVVALAPASQASSRVDNAARIAVHQIGDPYSYGASGPNAFDCSGLMYYSFRHAGFWHIPRTADSQSHFARHISRSSLRRGDLMFFYSGGHVYHVAMFLRHVDGHIRMLHSPRPGQRVQRARPWTNSWFAGTLR